MKLILTMWMTLIAIGSMYYQYTVGGWSHLGITMLFSLTVSTIHEFIKSAKD